MVRITYDLLKKRSEHNEGIVHSLQEITLHQFNIEKIELLGKHCRHLKILYLQNNLISKIGMLLCHQYHILRFAFEKIKKKKK